jgi:hypothetical protein
MHDGERKKKRSELFIFTYQWQWWVIYPNFRKFGFGGAPLSTPQKPWS